VPSYNDAPILSSLSLQFSHEYYENKIEESEAHTTRKKAKNNHKWLDQWFAVSLCQREKHRV